MDHYIDISLLPDPEFTQNMLMGALFNKLHRALVAMQSNRLAISYPTYQGKGRKRHLGTVFRLHGSSANLQTLMQTNWLRGMNDHINKTEVQAVPSDHQHLQVSRVQCKSSVNRLRERYIRRRNVSAEQAIAAIPIDVEQTLNLPFVMVKSASTKQQFRLFIQQTVVANENLDATFNSYGLSQNGTVPSF